MQPAYLLACLFLPLIGLISLAVASAAPDPFPLVSLPNRAVRRHSHHAQTQASPPPAFSTEQRASIGEPDAYDLDVLPFVLVSTINGALHAIDRDTGKVRWTLRDGVEPLVGGGSRGPRDEEEYIVEPLSGSLYVFDGNESDPESSPKVRKLPLSVEQLIELSPFTFPHSPSRIFTGSKQTSFITLDLRTGQQLDCYSSFSPLFNFSTQDDGVCENDLLDDLEGGRPNRDTLFVGRTDYRLTIHTAPTISGGFSASAVPLSKTRGVQDIVYSTYTPNSYDRPLAEYWARTGGRQHDGEKRHRVEFGFDGQVLGVEEGIGAKWYQSLDSVGVAVYDVLLPHSPAANPIILPQPPADPVALFPPQPRFDVVNMPPSTYIGSVPFTAAMPLSAALPEDDDSSSEVRKADRPLLFALSSYAYPFIHFAHPPRPGGFNGSFLLSEDLPERDQLLPYLLDPPKGEENALVVAPDPAGMAVVEAAGVSNAAPSRMIREREVEFKGWWWWFAAILGALTLCGATILRRMKGKEAAAATMKVNGTTIAGNEKTPALPSSDDKAVAESADQINGGLSIEPSAIPVGVLTEDGSIQQKKKPTRRRVRGKKKRRNSAERDDGGDGDDDDDDKGDTSPKDDGSSTPPESAKSAEKPLPDLPRELSSTGLPEDKERLEISDTVIGFGSHGTVVLKGTWGGRPVAVKRLLSDFVRLASQEVKLLQASDDHPNVIRYFCQERRDNFLYIALDLCQASLADLIETPDRHLELASVLDRKKALSQISAGLKHLHGMKIIHRDIKPQNVLVSRGKDGALRMLVSDFGLARRLEQGQSSFAPTANNLAGSLGWRAPECIRGQVKLNEGFDPIASSCSSGSTVSSTGSFMDLSDDGERTARAGGTEPHMRLTKAVDLFALGCLYFWVLMGGEHPFGETYNRESNIVKGDAVNMAQLDILGEEGVEAKDLIGRLLSTDPAQRPDTAECLVHPFFWTPAKRLAFLCDASDRFEIMETEPPESTLVLLESDPASVVGRDWYSRLDRVFTSSLGKYRKYKGNSVRDLLRAMRNKKHHYQDLEPSVQRHMGALPAGFLQYFTSRYPRLFLHVHGVVRNSRLRHEPMFEGYFQDGG